ncbi:MAG: hypothetical protein KC425_22680 [Anaerolineales bacterium]|nr:hypothetical protein [Anaerolineales bacterium]
MTTLIIIVLFAIAGIVLCLNPFRHTHDYGRRHRASIRNLSGKYQY